MNTYSGEIQTMSEVATPAANACGPVASLGPLLIQTLRLVKELEAAGIDANRRPDNLASYRLRTLRHVGDALSFAIGVRDRVEPHQLQWMREWSVNRLVQLGYEVHEMPGGEIAIIDGEIGGN